MNRDHSHLRGHPATRATGFTVVELIVALTVLGLCMVGVLGFFIQSLGMFHADTGRLRVNSDVRALTNELTDYATYANAFAVFPSYTDRSTPLNDGSSGDFIVLIYKDRTDFTKIERLVGYYRTPVDALQPAGPGTLHRFDLTLSPSRNAPLADLLPGIVDAVDDDLVIEQVRGLSNDRLFYNFYDRSIMIRGEIIHRGALTRRAMNTYNFTVTPRG